MGLGSQLLVLDLQGKDCTLLQAQKQPSPFAVKLEASRNTVMIPVGGSGEEVMARGSPVGEIFLPSGDIYWTTFTMMAGSWKHDI